MSEAIRLEFDFQSLGSFDCKANIHSWLFSIYKFIYIEIIYIEISIYIYLGILKILGILEMQEWALEPDCLSSNLSTTTF